MKFSYAIVPIVTLCSVLAHGKAPAGATPVSFTEEGLTNAINVGIKSGKGDASKSVTQAIDFFKRNPKVVQSAMDEVDKDEHAEAKAQAIKLFAEMYEAKGGLDLYEAKLKAVSYTYEHPEFLKLVQDVIFRVKKDNPTIVDDYFMTWEKVAKSDPSLITAVKEHVITFSETNEKAYKQIVEMVLKTAMIDPKFSANVVNHVLRVDHVACAGIASGCDCNGGNGGEAEEEEAKEEEADEESAPDATSPGEAKPTELVDDAEAEAPTAAGSAEDEASATEGAETPEAEEDDAPEPAEGAGSLEPEAEATPAAEGAEDDADAADEPTKEEDTPAPAAGSYNRPAEPKPLGYARPAPPKPLGYARPQ